MGYRPELWQNYFLAQADAAALAGPSRTRKEVTAMTATRRPRLGPLMTLPRRAIRALRHVNGEFLRASQAIIRSARASQPTGEGARGRAS